MSAPAHTDLQAALDAEHAQRIALQHHAADQAQRVADLEAEIERLRGLLSREQQARHAALAEVDRITEAGRAHIRRAAAFEAQRDALAEKLAEIAAQPSVAWIEHELQGTGLRHLHFERRPNTLRDDVVAPVWTELIARPACDWPGKCRHKRPAQAAAPEQAGPRFAPCGRSAGTCGRSTHGCGRRECQADTSEPVQAEPDHLEDARRMVCATRGLLGATSGVGRECDLWIGGACTSPVSCHHQQQGKPCRCGPGGCSDRVACPKGGAA